jgi:junctophilin
MTSSSGGRFDFDDGGSYAGDWSDGMAHGHGVCTGPRGEGEYAGAWQNGFETSGVYRTGPTNEMAAAGPVYEGQWLQGRRHGLGIDSRGRPGAAPGGPRWLYRGEWTQGFRGRYGVRQSTGTGTKYEGTWTAGLQDGYGVETYADGGTFQGQWLRGVRHGYGIRSSASYEVAIRYPTHSGQVSLAVPTTAQQQQQRTTTTAAAAVVEKEDDILLRERDWRIEESRGGFVLRAKTTAAEQYGVSSSSADNKHRMILDKHGKPSLRKTIVKEFRMIRQRSTGDLNDPTSRSNSRMSGGSVRSTTSQISNTGSVGTTTTGFGSVYSDDGSNTSFISEPDLLQSATSSYGGGLTEKYSGEWKGDRRAGYGVAERSDGLRYEGEWAGNRKHGYGVTTLQDGTRIEGKYKNNVLVASANPAGKSSSAVKLFPLRSGKMRDRVEAAVRAASKAADVARQKAEIANARMLSARMKAEQAEEVAKKAVLDAETARSKARHYLPGGGRNTGNKASSIIANRPTSESDMQVEFVNTYHQSSSPTDGYNITNYDAQFQQQTATPSKSKFSLFKSRKTPSQQNVAAATTAEMDGAAPWTQQHPDGGASGPVPTTYYTMPNGRQQTQPGGYYAGNSQQYQSGGGITTMAGDGFDNEPTISQSYQQQAYSGAQQQPYGMTPQSTVPMMNPGSNFYPEMMPSSHQQQQQQQYPGGYDRIPTQPRQQYPYGLQQSANYEWGSPAAGGGGGGGVVNGVGRSTFAHGDTYNTPSANTPADWRRAAMTHTAGQRSFDESTTVSAHRERRNSLPSIVKQRTQQSAAMTTVPDQVPVTRQRPAIDTFVIDKGVRKRVKSIYDETSARNPVNVQQTLTGNPAYSPSEVVRSRRKMYALESTRRHEMGSVPDISALSKDIVLPREVVSVLSQRRREELFLQRELDERRQRNQIVFHLGDMLEWCDRRRMLVFLVAVNISLASIFYNMMTSS